MPRGGAVQRQRLQRKNVYSAAAPNATICLAGYSNKDSKLSLSQISQKHLTVFGVYNGVGNFSSAINSLVTGTVKVENCWANS